MDTFLVTYRYFTNGKHVLQALIAFYHQLEEDRTGKNKQLENGHAGDANNNNDNGERKVSKFLGCFLISRSPNAIEGKILSRKSKIWRSV